MRPLFSHLEVLSPAEIELVHQSSLDILETTGVRMPNRYVLERLADCGAVVDFANAIVQMPSALIDTAMAHWRAAWQQAKACDEEAAPHGLPKWHGSISTQVQSVDLSNNQWQAGTREDILKGIVVANHLENIPTIRTTVIPHDVVPSVADVVAYQLLCTYSQKPGGTYILSPQSVPHIVELAGLRGFALDYFLETISPLQFRDVSLEIAVMFAEQGLPLAVGPMVIGGATGPITLAGTLTLQNAEILASCVLVYLLSPHSPIEYNCPCHSMDLRTTLCSFGLPNQALFGVAAAQLASFYGLPGSANLGLSDAIMPDFQSGWEKAFTAALGAAAGLKGLGCQGIVGADQGASLEQLVIDDEWIGAMNYAFRGFEVTEETIGLDTIKRVGIGGNFLAEEHTVEHMHEHYWSSELFNRSMWAKWQDGGGLDTLAQAKAKVERLLRDFYPPEPVVSPSMQREIDAIVGRAEE